MLDQYIFHFFYEKFSSSVQNCELTWLIRSEQKLPDLHELNVRGRSGQGCYLKLFSVGFLLLNICIFCTQGVLG